MSDSVQLGESLFCLESKTTSRFLHTLPECSSSVVKSSPPLCSEVISAAKTGRPEEIWVLDAGEGCCVILSNEVVHGMLAVCGEVAIRDDISIGVLTASDIWTLKKKIVARKAPQHDYHSAPSQWWW